MAHRGEKAYRDVFDLVHRREAEGPNQILQADYTLLDLWVTREGEKPTRPWLTIIVDDYSRAIAGYFRPFDSPSAPQTSLALTQAIWRKAESKWQVFGIPEILGTDNGSDFTSENMEQVAADLKMRLTSSIPVRSRGRGRIERLFQTVKQIFL
ncbi:MAG: transposase family protein [Armatimonadota bacterium]